MISLFPPFGWQFSFEGRPRIDARINTLMGGGEGCCSHFLHVWNFYVGGRSSFDAPKVVEMFSFESF